MKRIHILLIAVPLFANDATLTLDHWESRDGDATSWTASGPPVMETFNNRYHGVRWYRTSVEIPPRLLGNDLAIEFGWLDECYEVFAEGVPIGAFGKERDGNCQSPQPSHRSFRIPARLIHPGQIQITVRRSLNGPSTAWLALSAAERARRHAPVLGEANVIESMREVHTLSGQRTNLFSKAVYLLNLIAGLVSLAFFAMRRQGRDYLLTALYCLSFGLPLAAVPLFADESTGARSPMAVLVLGIFVAAFPIAILILAELCPRYQVLLRVMAVVFGCGSLGGPWTLATGSAAGIELYLFSIRILPLPYLVALWGMRGDPAIGPKVVAVVLSLYSVLDGYSSSLGLRNWNAGPFVFDIRFVGQFAFVLTLMVVLYQRLQQDHLRQARMEEDLAAARRIQETLLARGPLAARHFTVDAAYLPAREVGGDFHVEIAGPDYSPLVVVGDVSGKGLPAAMLVSTAIGALADLASRRPADVLAHLNRTFAGRTSGGFVTCCCILLYPDGEAIGANAGHIPPYMDAADLACGNGLPLGVVADVEYEERHLRFEGGQLTFLSDGVVEAANAKGELFGFDRTREISMKSATEIAEAARAWGQNDDITVVTVRRRATA